MLKIAPLVALETKVVRPSGPFIVPVHISRSAKLTAPLQLEAFPVGDSKAKWAEVDVAAVETTANLRIVPPSRLNDDGPVTLVIRAKVLQTADIPQLDEKHHATPMPPEMIAILRSGYLPVIAETRVTIHVQR